MGHRVLGHEGRCRNLHGHNYVARLTAEADALDAVGRVVDFSVLKAVGGWIEQNWDHGFLLHKDDPLLSLWGSGFPLEMHKFYRMGENPTAENIARYLLEEVCVTLFGGGQGFRVVRVVVEETENCSAEATL
jgi:6-pyruvoyltetrahydropterin/6-carboxytetrahydropterin synthase